MSTLHVYGVTLTRNDTHKTVYFEVYSDTFIDADSKVRDMFSGCDVTYNMEEVQ